ncbi:glutathione S-transferase [Aestuariicella hydrocarbonica]|uniref:Glutathione S-transferase n=1 Tax=Pseudomaricurvus hydrocarbonicus TaxID=1470433 RepID=A0A9E5JV55_9GAMM|nr:glutathione S-transferase family protein [Aestuariicella hydrocarbonica]NHO65854.1 glutathione S-transferase [Aestuariicella hydrocarbonica]
MVDYKLYYWELPFRGIFIQLLLEDMGARYSRLDALEIYPAKSLSIHHPGMAPPYLYDCQRKKYFSQMPACLMHLAHRHDYLPKRPERLTLALKTLLDCNDVLMEITNSNGMLMWTPKRWEEFRYQRLADWMVLFENTGREHNLKDNRGFLLGSTLSVADIATTALFGTMVYSFPALKADLIECAPHIANLCQRIESRPAIQAFLTQHRSEYGRDYCGGQIEQSLRQMMNA